ncbi:MAG TPA: PhnD/SsuA/transferrin family substrate-binding protein [Methylomirabilota bacterium]|nr:PhnD/SsuA/transferrin family substrate-binding protein [Methylomirabilota bacterium]
MRKCRGCGAEIPANAPFGHCPSCLLQLGFGPLPKGAEVSSPADAASRRIFGEYELLEQIGRGGMGVIYRARQLTLNRLVALKMVSAGEFASPTMIQRFHLEAESAANLHHPNIVPIYETGEHEGQHFFSMELIDGVGLDRHIMGGGFSGEQKPGKEKPSPRARQEQIARIMAKVARAVDYAHQHGILHRDIKPSNVLLDHRGEPRLTDFGVAKVVGHTGSGLTASGAIMGTPSYMAPEQAAGEGKRVTIAADIYSLGAVLYSMLTGHPPFHAATPVQTLKQVVEDEPKHPTTFSESIDHDLATICMKCLEKEPPRRYSSAVALAEDLERWLRKEPIEARSAGPVLRVQKWVQRNRAATLLILSLCLGLVACLALLHFVQKARLAKDGALDVIKQGLDKRLDDLWLDPNRGAFEHITSAELAAYAGSDWAGRKGRTNTLAFGAYTYTKPGRMLGTFAPILLRLGNEVASATDERVEIDLFIFRSYESALTAMEEGRLHFMRMGPSSYLQLKSRNPKVELLASQIHTEPLTLAIFTHTNSGIRILRDVRRRSFAFGDTNSTTGNFVAKWMLSKAELRLADLARYEHLASQSDVIDGVARTDFDAGAANYDLVRKRPELNTIGRFSMKNIGLCWVAGTNLESRLTGKLRGRLIAMKDRSVFSNLESTVTGFQALDDPAFDELRQIMRQADLFAEPGK